MAQAKSGCRQSRNGVTNAEKRDLLTVWDECGDIRTAIARVFPLLPPECYAARRRSAYQWKATKESVFALAKRPQAAKRMKQRPIGTGTALSTSDELGLVGWVNRLRGEGVPVSVTMLSKKAAKVAKKAGKKSFVASPAWHLRFRRRHRLSLRAKTRQGQIRPQDAAERAAAFGREVSEKMLELGVDRVYNADQTAVLFEYIPKRTIDTVGAKTVWVRCANDTKTRATAMLLADSLGNKMQPTVVLKTTPSKVAQVAEINERERHGFGVRLFKKVRGIQDKTGMQIFGNKSGWWNEKLHKHFLASAFGEREPKSPVLLLIDEFSGHWTDNVCSYAKSVNVHLMKVPAGLTSVCQPADISWMKPFKDQMRSFWVDSLMEQLESRVPDKPFKFESPKVETVCEWVDASWEKLSKRSICSRFERAHIDQCTALAVRLEVLKLVEDVVCSDEEFHL